MCLLYAISCHNLAFLNFHSRYLTPFIPLCPSHLQYDLRICMSLFPNFVFAKYSENYYCRRFAVADYQLQVTPGFLLVGLRGAVPGGPGRLSQQVLQAAGDRPDRQQPRPGRGQAPVPQPQVYRLLGCVY